jgi:hypothetical protein
MRAEETDMADNFDMAGVLVSASGVCSLDRGTGNGHFEEAG